MKSKRIPVYHKDVWVDSDPIEIKDLSSLDHIGRKIMKLLRKDFRLLENENLMLKGRLERKEREIAERMKKDKPRLDEKSKLDEKTEEISQISQPQTDEEISQISEKKPP